MPERDLALDKHAVAVGAAVRERSYHSRENLAIGRDVRSINEPGNSTHSDGIPTSNSNEGAKLPVMSGRCRLHQPSRFGKGMEPGEKSERRLAASNA